VLADVELRRGLRSAGDGSKPFMVMFSAALMYVAEMY
jgi:hypothetical protein